LSAQEDPALFGIPELDSLLLGQLPKGWLALLSGTPGSGLELLAKQFSQAGPPGRPALFYTTSERTEDIRRALKDFGWRDDIRIENFSDEYYDQVLSKALEVSRFRERGISPQELAQFRLESIEPPPVDFITRVLVQLSTLEEPFRLIIDSLDFFLEQMETASVISLVRQVRARAQRVGGYALLTYHPDIHDAKTTGTLEDIADLLLDVRVKEVGSRNEHYLDLRKVRNHPERTGSVRMVISEHGLTSSS
jgi:KaiC/GvpD/RAD55 family RecA-like ATPase